MLGVLLRRLFSALPVLAIVSLITFGMIHLIPGDPAAVIAGMSATPEQIARVSHFLHLDQPIWEQYLRFFWNLVGHGGNGQPVGLAIADVVGV